MRIVCVLFTLLVITVTSLARPQEPENSSKTTTAVPLTPTIKNNDTPSGTPASMGKSNEKPNNNVIARTTPSIITTAGGKLKEDVANVATALTKTAVTPVTTDNTKVNLSSSAITTSDKISSSTTAISTTTVTTTAVPPATSTTSSAATTVTTAASSPTIEIVTTNNSNIVTTLADVTTAVPATTTCPPSDRHFDGLSFLGGIILTLCLIGIGIFLCKYCQHVCEDKYRTL